MTPRAALLAAALLACAPPAIPAPVSPVLQDMTVSTGPKAPVPADIPPGAASEAPASAPAPSPDPRLAETQSNHPGINAPYRARGAAPRWARRFERDGREVHDHRAELVRALNLRPGMAVADLGAGTGLFTVAFAEAVGPTGTVYAVDLIPAFLAHIRAKVERAGFTQVQLIQASHRSAELPPASVDLVFMSDVYHHLEYPQHVLASLRQALRPGGSLWVVDFQREPGRSPAWVLSHVRAGKAEVLRELALAGFELVAEHPLLRDNYVLQLHPRAG